MPYHFLASFIGGILLAVRLMFYGAERRHRPAADSLPVRRWEPAMVGFLLVFGIAGYLMSRGNRMASGSTTLASAVVGMIGAIILMRLAIATARFRPVHDPEDVRFLLQGRVGIVTAEIPAGGVGVISYEDGASTPSLRARELDGNRIAVGVEICIDRLEDGIAYVEPWAHVEERL